MAESTTKLIFEGDVGKAIMGIVKLVEKMKEAKGEVKDFGKVSKDGGHTLTNAFDEGAASVKNFIMVAAGITGFIASTRKLVEHFKEIISLRSGMVDTALSVEQVGLKLAQLRKDTSQKGIESALGDIKNVSQTTGVSMEVASKTLYFAESAMGAGTDAAKTAGLNIAKFAGPAGLTPEETKLIPKLFSITKADTDKKQKEVLNQLLEATAGSIAETGEFIAPFISTVVSDIERGFSLPESLAKMTAAIETTGSVSEAATISERFVDVLAGRTAESLKFLKKEAKSRGVDFAALTDPERMQFGKQIFEEYKTSERMDVLKTKLDVRGFSALRAMFSETGQRKYNEMLPVIEGAKNKDEVEKIYQTYLGLLTARNENQKTTNQMTKYETGKEMFGEKALIDRTKTIFEDFHAEQKGFWETINEFLIPDIVEQTIIRKEIIRRNLIAARELAPPGSARRRQIDEIYPQVMENIFDYQITEKAAKLTNDFQAIDQYQGQIPGKKYWFNTEDTTYTVVGKAIDNLIKAIDRNTNSLENLQSNPPIGPHVGIE